VYIPEHESENEMTLPDHKQKALHIPSKATTESL